MSAGPLVGNECVGSLRGRDTRRALRPLPAQPVVTDHSVVAQAGAHLCQRERVGKPGGGRFGRRRRATAEGVQGGADRGLHVRKGKRGTPGGSGPAALHKIPPQAYPTLQGQVPGLGPAFFTKFLYFTGTAVPPAHGPRSLILDRGLSRRLRQIAAAVGRESGHDADGLIAAWAWSDSNWTAHRYEVYLMEPARWRTWSQGCSGRQARC